MPDVTVTSADGTPLAARRSGDGTPIVLVHGGNGDLDSFLLIEGPLAEQHTVWVYSRRGRGGSGDGADYSIEREIEDVIAVAEAAGGDVHLFGHSSGALYAMLASGRLPSLRSLILYEPPCHLDRMDSLLIEDIKTAVDADDPGRALELFFPAASIVPQEIEVIRSLEGVWERACAGVRLLPREADAFVGLSERLAAWQPPDVPILYLYGEETESALFLTLDEVAEFFPKAVERGIPGQRHLAPAFDPVTFSTEIKRFTASV